MGGDWITVGSFGGGLNYLQHPLALQDDEWTSCEGVIPKDGTAEFMAAQSQVIAGASWLPALNEPFGIVQDLFSADAVLVPTRVAAGTVRLFRIDYLGTVTEIPVTGTAPTSEAATSIRPKAAIWPHMYNGQQVFPCGATTGNRLLQYDGTNFTRITPTSGSINARHLVPVAGHLLAGRCDTDKTRIRVSDATSLVDWDPSALDSSDDFTLDAPGEILAMQASQDVCLVATHNRLYAMQSTGSIPAFTTSLLHEGAVQDQIGLMCQTPHGIFYLTDLDVMQGVNSPWSPGRKIRNDLSRALPKLLWDGPRGELIFRTSQYIYRADVSRGTWHRYLAPIAINVMDHCYVQRGVASTTLGRGHWMVDINGTVYRYRDIDVEDTRTNVSGYTSAFVTSKVFAFSEKTAYVDKIRVSWEPVRDNATDTVKVYARCAQDYFPTGVTQTGSMNIGSAGFSLIGTSSSSGSTELNCRLHGRYLQLGFGPGAGMARIRGFAFRVKPSSDRPLT